MLVGRLLLLLVTAILVSLEVSIWYSRLAPQVQHFFKPRYVSVNQAFLLSESQVVELDAAAGKGDGEGAYKLYTHYAFAKADVKKARYYCEMAASLGNAKAKETLRVWKEDAGSVGRAEGEEHDSFLLPREK